MTSSAVTHASGFRRSARCFSSSRAGSLDRPLGDAGHDLGIARAQPHEPFGPEPLVGRRIPASSGARLEDLHGLANRRSAIRGSRRGSRSARLRRAVGSGDGLGELQPGSRAEEPLGPAPRGSRARGAQASGGQLERPDGWSRPETRARTTPPAGGQGRAGTTSATGTGARASAIASGRPAAPDARRDGGGLRHRGRCGGRASRRPR